MTKICFIGYGNMAKAIAQGLIHQSSLQLSATSPSLAAGVTAQGVTTHFNNDAFVSEADIIIIAVKPAKVISVLNEIQAKISSHTVVVSIAAGVSLSKLADHCPPEQPIIRCMPNTPIAVGKGATPFIANDNVSKIQKATVENLFLLSGITAWVDNENDINTFTALSGSGPAYVFYFIEAITNAAEKMGLSKELATSFTLQTINGSLSLLEKTGLSAAELRKKVTSPAGTTAAAIGILEQQNFELLIYNAMNAAYERALQLNDLTRA